MVGTRISHFVRNDNYDFRRPITCHGLPCHFDRREKSFLWAARVKQGGHDVPRADVLRRFDRSWVNFEKRYRLLADAWGVYDSSGAKPRFLEKGP